MKRRETRVTSAEIRVERRDDGKAKIVGHAAVFNRRSVDLGGFVEIIIPGAFKRALEISDIRSLWNHNSDSVLGRTTSGSHRVEEDEQGLWTETDPPDTQPGRDAVTLIERGDVSQMSFAFRLAKNGDKWEQLEDGMFLRTINEFEELFDTSPVTYPGYPDTDVALRALERIRRSVSTGAAVPPALLRSSLERTVLDIGI